jgi:hypothetical protein
MCCCCFDDSRRHPRQPAGLSSIIILSIDLGTEVAPAISLSNELEVGGFEVVRMETLFSRHEVIRCWLASPLACC